MRFAIDWCWSMAGSHVIEADSEEEAREAFFDIERNDLWAIADTTEGDFVVFPQ